MSQLPKATVFAAYARIRDRLASHTLLEAKHGYRIDVMDARVGAFDGDVERFWEALHGPEQFRLAGLMVLQEAVDEDSSVVAQGPLTVSGSFTMFTGDLKVNGDLIVADGAALVVLGRLLVEGNVIGGTVDYSVIAARSIEMQSGVTVGELLATETIVASDRLHLADADHSCRSPRVQARVLVDYERSNRFEEVIAAVHVSQWDPDAAARALGFDPERTNLLRDFRLALTRK